MKKTACCHGIFRRGDVAWLWREDMAFLIGQRFEDAQHEYDRKADVLYISFGLPRPAVALTVEDWLVIRISPSPPQVCGLTIIGFKSIFSHIRPDLIQELPERIYKLRKARFRAEYSDETDTLTLRFEEEQPAYYERFSENIYLERSLVGREIVGFKITRYTEQGESAVEKLLSSMIEALFAAPGTAHSQADALTRAFLEHIDIPKLLSVRPETSVVGRSGWMGLLIASKAVASQTEGVRKVSTTPCHPPHPIELDASPLPGVAST